MSTPVDTVRPDKTVREATTRLHDEGIGCLVVTENDEAIGMFTEYDVTGVVSEGLDPEAVTVREIMTRPLVTTDPDSTLREAAETLHENGITRLPVLDDGELVGILTTTDISNYIPHVVRMGDEQEIDETRERKSVRVDTAYERDAWDFEYLGDETDITVGDTVTFSKTVSQEDVETFAEISGDTNRLHMDGEYAEGTRFGQRIAHGALVGSMISAALARLPGMIIYLSQEVSYVGPVPLGERVTAECEVVEQMGDERFRLTTKVRTEDGDVVIDGEAVIISAELPVEEKTVKQKP